MSHPIRAIVLILLLVVSGCETQRTVTSSRTELDPIRQKFAGNYEMERDENGMIKVKSDKRSEYETKAFSGTKTSNIAKDYKKKSFTGSKKFDGSKEFEGSKQFATKSFADSKRESRFKWPWEGTKTASESKKAFDSGSPYSTKSLVDGDRTYATQESPQVANRRAYPDAPMKNFISPNPGQGPGPSIGDVRSLLGKDP